MQNNYVGRELKDLSKEELINIIRDLHSVIRDQDMNMLHMRADVERANSLAQRYRTRLEATQEGHLSLVTDAVLDRALLQKPMGRIVSLNNGEHILATFQGQKGKKAS